MLNDGALFNALTGLGTSIDPVAQYQARARVELGKHEIDALMTEWGIRKHVEGPPAEALLKGFVVTLKGEVADDAQQRLQDRLNDLGATEALEKALKLDRQYGGAALVPRFNGNPGAPIWWAEDMPVQVPKIFGIEAVSRHRLMQPTGADIDLTPGSDNYRMPGFYRLIASEGSHTKVHASRLWVWRGWHPGEPDLPYDWGRSVIEQIDGPWTQYVHALGHVVSAAGRIAEPRLKKQGLFARLQSGDAQAISKYAQELQRIRSALRMWVIDGEDEFSDANLSFAGARDVVEMTRENVAGAVGVSAQKFFGLRHQGMSDNDETGAQRDEAEVQRYRRKHVLPALNWLVALVIRELQLGGVESWEVTFPALREETARERADRKQVEAQTMDSHQNADRISPEEGRATLLVDPDNTYALDEELDELGEPDDIEDPEDTEDPEDEEDPEVKP